MKSGKVTISNLGMKKIDDFREQTPEEDLHVGEAGSHMYMQAAAPHAVFIDVDTVELGTAKVIDS